MADRRGSDRGISTGLTVGAVLAVTVCCGLPLLIAAGVLTSAGVLFDNLLVVVIGAVVLGWALTRALHLARARNRHSDHSSHSDT